MLVVKVELWPWGDASRAQEIARAEIGNISACGKISDYTIDVRETGNERLGIKPLNAGFFIRKHDREQSVWSLIAKVAKKAISKDGS